MLHFALVQCRAGCGACCIAISISSSIPGMPEGKPAGVRCVQLTRQNLCALWGLPERPRVCGALRASEDMCGSSFGEACRLIEGLEAATATPLPAEEAR